MDVRVVPVKPGRLVCRNLHVVRKSLAGIYNRAEYIILATLIPDVHTMEINIGGGGRRVHRQAGRIGCDRRHRGIVFARRLIVINRSVRLEYERAGGIVLHVDNQVVARPHMQRWLFLAVRCGEAKLLQSSGCLLYTSDAADE